MDILPSAEFRKRFARLTEPVLVTVNGHAIGSYFPTVTVHPNGLRTPDSVYWDRRAKGASNDEAIAPERDRFNSRPFTPAPKKEK